MKTALSLAFLVIALTASAQTLEEMVADPALWPKEVTLTGATKVVIMKDGQPSGAMLVGAGKKLVVTGVLADGILGRIGGALVKVPVEKTDLLGAGAHPAPATGGTMVVHPGAAAAASARDPSGPAERPGVPNAMQRLLEGRLVRFTNGRLEAIGTDQLRGVKYFGLYYSAGWCGPCRQFTPSFIKYYLQLRLKHPEFEVIFISSDRSARDMATYMRDDSMPWPAVQYDLRSEKITSYCGSGIPCLVLVDTKGQVLSDSFEGDNYVGPGKVLQDAERIMGRGM